MPGPQGGEFSSISARLPGALFCISPVSGEFLPFLSADPLKLCQVGWGKSLHSYFQVSPEMFDQFKSGQWLDHLRTFSDLSRSHSCIFLAVRLGSLSCWKVNILPSMRS